MAKECLKCVKRRREGGKEAGHLGHQGKRRRREASGEDKELGNRNQERVGNTA